MLTLITDSGPVLIQDTEYYVRQLASGLDEVIFSISVYDPIYAQIEEEMQILDRGGLAYLVKQVDGGPEVAKVIAQIDVDDWKAQMLLNYGSASNTLYNTLNAIKPAGWTVIDQTGYTYRRTVEGNLTPFEIVQAACNTFGAYPRWDNQAKTLTLYNQIMPEPVGAFATRELNLREINYKGKSQGFATRLYAYGKDGLSFASINGGKAYVDDHTYSSRTIAAYWKDERYTVKENLLLDARKKLAAMAIPQRSYDCSVVDLQAVDPEKYAALDFSLLSSAVLIDDLKHTQITYQVLERYDYPYHPEQNRVIFNSAPALITGDITTVANTINDPNSAYNQGIVSSIEDAENAATAYTDAAAAAAKAYTDAAEVAARSYTDTALQTAKDYADNATDWLTSGQGYIVAVQNDDGSWKELLFMDTASTATARKVLRINENGLGFSSRGVSGPYTQAWTLDGKLIVGGTDAVTLAAYDGSQNVIFSVDKSGIAWDLSASRMTKNGAQYFKAAGATATSGNVICISSAGIAFSTRGWNGPYTQAWSINGQLTIGGTNNVQLQAVNGSGGVLFKVSQAGISWDLKQSKMTTDGLLYFLGNGATASRGNVLRISSAGIAFSKNGYNGSYAQAWTIDGILTLGGAGNRYGLLRILDSGNRIAVDLSDGVLELYSYDGNGAKKSEANLTGSGMDVYGNDGSYMLLGPGALELDDGDGNSATYGANGISITAGDKSLAISPEGVSIETADIPTLPSNELTVAELRPSSIAIEGEYEGDWLYGVDDVVTLPGGWTFTIKCGVIVNIEYGEPGVPEDGYEGFFIDGEHVYFHRGIMTEIESTDD